MQVLIVVKGEGEVWIDGEWVTCHAGQGYLTPTGESHAYRSDNWKVVWVILLPGASLVFPEKPTLREMNPEPLLHILHGLYLEMSMKPNQTAQEHWCELLWHSLVNLLEVPPSRLWRLWRQVQENPAENWTLTRLAQAAGLGAENLRLICHRELGRSPCEHLAHLRMEHAASLLKAGHKVEFVARRVGYENPFTFSTAFKRVMGVPPSRISSYS